MLKQVIFSLILISGFAVQAQHLMTIGDEKVTVDEFKRIYQKNNNSKTSYSEKEVNEYLELFTLYKMKLKEAYLQKLDTLPSIKEDYTKYTDQLVQNYYLDKNYTENLYKHQYEHLKNDIKVAHIMVKCAQTASPADSLIAFNKLKFIRDKATKEIFSDLAKEHSEDKASSVNGGMLGFIAAFMTNYEFEEPIYHTDLNSISPIVRTSFGYHIIHILEKRSAKGRIKVAHIFMKHGDKKEEEKQMQEAYQALKSKKLTFSDAVNKYSQDASTKSKSGELPEFGVSEMVQEFEDQCFNLKNPEDISQPFKTEYGWHLIKLLEKKPLANYESTRDWIKEKMQRDPRIGNERKLAFQNILTKHTLFENLPSYNTFLAQFNDSFFKDKNWKMSVSKALKSEPIFTFNKQNVLFSDFVNFSNINFNTTASRNKSELIKLMYEAYKERKIWDMTKDILSKENQDYAQLENEYKSGLMIFEIMDKEIWKKAVLDTNGTKALYEKVKNDYWYKNRYVTEGIKFTNPSIRENVKALVAKNPSIKFVLNQLKKSKDSNDIVLFEQTVEKGDLTEVDQSVTAKTLQFSYQDDSKTNFVGKISKQLEPSIKPYSEIKGRIQNLYQTQIESEWNQSLRKKYLVQINQPVLQKIIVH